MRRSQILLPLLLEERPDTVPSRPLVTCKHTVSSPQVEELLVPTKILKMRVEDALAIDDYFKDVRYF